MVCEECSQSRFYVEKSSRHSKVVRMTRQRVLRLPKRVTKSRHCVVHLAQNDFSMERTTDQVEIY